MPWSAVAGVAGSVISGALSDDKNGGAGTTTASKEPWAEAAPWLKDLLAQGQSLNNQYTATPFNAQQQQAYGSMANQSAYMQNLTPSLLGQLSGQQLGYDRNNPGARPQAFNFNGLMGGGAATQGAQPAGLLSMLGGGNAINSSMMALPQATLPMAPVVEPTKKEEEDTRDPYAWLFQGNN